MSSTNPADPVADTSTRNGISPTTIVIWIIVIGALVAGIYLLIRTSEPPCSTCHIERLNRKSLGGTETECWLNGRIRHDWEVAPGALFASINNVALEDINDPDGYLRNECLNIRLLSCPKKEEEPFLNLVFLNPHRGTGFPNPLCQGDCPKCPKR